MPIITYTSFVPITFTISLPSIHLPDVKYGNGSCSADENLCQPLKIDEMHDHMLHVKFTADKYKR